MAKRSKYFLVFLLLMFSAKGFSQPKMLSIWNMNSDSTPIHIQSSRFIFSSSKLLVKIPKNFVIAGICSPETYKMGIGFFCKKELELDRITPVPVRFRLGSLEYVNWLEKKPNALNNGRWGAHHLFASRHNLFSFLFDHLFCPGQADDGWNASWHDAIRSFEGFVCMMHYSWAMFGA